MTNFIAYTSFVCPNRCDRAMACSSIEGFHQGSIMKTLLAACKFKPTDPILMVMISTLMLGFFVNSSILVFLIYVLSFPSRVWINKNVLRKQVKFFRESWLSAEPFLWNLYTQQLYHFLSFFSNTIPTPIFFDLAHINLMASQNYFHEEQKITLRALTTHSNSGILPQILMF